MRGRRGACDAAAGSARDVTLGDNCAVTPSDSRDAAAGDDAGAISGKGCNAAAGTDAFGAPDAPASPGDGAAGAAVASSTTPARTAAAAAAATARIILERRQTTRESFTRQEYQLAMAVLAPGESSRGERSRAEHSRSGRSELSFRAGSPRNDMSLLLIISLVIQVLLIVHCIKTGRNSLWIWALALLSYAGIIAYVAVELVPDLFRSGPARRAARGMKKALDPEANLRRYAEEARVTGGVAARQRYADELTRHGRFEEAIAAYREALKGLYEHDPNLLLGIARAQFGKGEPSAARATLDELARHNPDFRSPEAQLLYARALEAEGNVAQALEAYRALAPAYPGAEASVRYAQLLAAQGEHAQAANVARELLEQARIAPAHYRRAQRDWLDLAERLAAR